MKFISSIWFRNVLQLKVMAAGLAALAPLMAAETGAEAWLRYAGLDAKTAKNYERLPSKVVVLGDSPVLKSAQGELVRGVSGMLGRTLSVASGSVASRLAEAVILGTITHLHELAPELHPPEQFIADGYWLKSARIGEHDCLIITAATDRGVLYGVFALLRKIARAENIATLDELQQPHAPLRWVNQWDNLDGRIERGYGGPSIFFADGKVRDDLTRAGQYARLLASIGINGCSINNVNADPRVLDGAFIEQVSRIADVFRPWGVQLALSVDLSSPKAL